ncbi:MAG: hypothetical protein H0X34_07770 [Chthoniobacterales bacterium]|nr:hypothetical protein [Chthoniobacterales bacterium]
MVAHNRRGCLNHVFLTVRSIEPAWLKCAGVVLNDLGVSGDVASLNNADILRRCLRLPIVEECTPESAAIPAQLREMLSQS